MKVLLNDTVELAGMDFDIDAATGLCNPKIDAFGYHIEGPCGKAALSSADGETLHLAMELPDVAKLSFVIEKSDIKKLKSLMNKDAIKFMVKALM